MRDRVVAWLLGCSIARLLDADGADGADCGRGRYAKEGLLAPGEARRDEGCKVTF
jgi:hypothetical protein